MADTGHYTGEGPPFCSMVRASGLGEIWTHVNDNRKFGQFGWRCTTKENSYSTNTLVGNWVEERFDLGKMKAAKPLPSQYSHYFDSTYGTDYSRSQTDTPPSELQHLAARHPHAHPAHQPELDSAPLKAVYNSWETTSRAAYLDPRLQTPTGAGTSAGQ